MASFTGEILCTLTGFTGNLNIRDKARTHLTALKPADNFDSFPETLKHGAVNLYGKVYEFNTGEGIICSKNPDMYKQNYGAEVCSKFKTGKSVAEFEKWIVKTQIFLFSKDNYHMIDNNCTHFVMNVCKYFEIEIPDIFTKQQAFLEEHKVEIELLAPAFFESRQKNLSQA